MEDDYDTTIGKLKSALNGSSANVEKIALLTWLSSLTESDNVTPAGDDDVIVIKHPK